MSSFETILLTTDLSETSRHAFAPAQGIAEKFGSTLLVLYVVEDRLPPFVDEFTSVPLEEILETHTRRATEALERFVADHLGAGVEAKRLVSHGTPHLEIVRLAEERKVDLIAMATHGRGFISHALFGSTAERVVRRAPCPVLTVRIPEPIS